ncbi:ABC transporter ATP-binding protein [Solwaraspora sp. WMMD791]|uniref:ABC transporter ATP-binding protein n=1 Tax=Solwaraspora sp. WMMD791 TaxID=3016086 RepID=UPI00249B13FD|nr:ABC transporter ATP-binding protein [Solwaraspora sp. WMMD791]WFE28719.1 ABC transporter ATP-binding protein [Solwaraspora sp. WMMD791]
MSDHRSDLPVEVPLNESPDAMSSSPANLLRARWQTVRLLRRGGPGVVTILALVNLLLGLLPVLFIVATSVLLGLVPAAVAEGLGSAAWDSLVVVFVGAALAFVAQQVITPLRTSLGDLVGRRVDQQVHDELMAASLSPVGIAPLEDEENQDRLRVAALKLQFAVQTPGDACAGLLALLARYTQLVAYAVLIGVAFSWLAAAGLVVSVLLMRHSTRGGLSRYAEARQRLSRAERRVHYIRALAVEPAAGKEIRVFGLVGWLTDTYRRVYLMWLGPLWAYRRRILLWRYLIFAGPSLAAAVSVFVAVALAAPTTLTLTQFALVVQATLGAIALGGYYAEADVQTAIGVSAYDDVRRFVSRLEVPATVSDPAGSPPPPSLGGDLHFDRVSFRYPGQDRTVLDELDLRIPVGKCTAIVGVNGAGKTTLVKLLARLYEPTSGVIRAGGVDIRSFPVAQWRAAISIIFQDFLRYETSVADNIAFGAVRHRDDRAGVRAAAAAVGLTESLDRLPAGLDTPLASHLTGGTDLSGGQWQRVALARALFAVRHGAPIVVLDEPTANLDVRAEARFFDQFAGLTRGVTSVLISHRFSTVRHADVIVVLEHGRVVERGSHAELMATGGRYARLFRLQADRVLGPENNAWDDADPQEVRQ